MRWMTRPVVLWFAVIAFVNSTVIFFVQQRQIRMASDIVTGVLLLGLVVYSIRMYNAKPQ